MLFYVANGRTMTFPIQKQFLLIFILSLLTGCSQKAAITGETIQQALWGTDDINLDRQHISDLPYASSYVKINNSARIFMVLAFAEENPHSGDMQLKWMSADNAMIVTENGRVIKTLNLPQHNLSAVTPRFGLFNFSSSQKQWRAIYDWQPDYNYDHTALINSYQNGQQWVRSTLWKKRLNVWQEDIKFVGSSQHMQNVFWADDQGQVLKSQQWLIPNQLYIEQEILKPYSSN